VKVETEDPPAESAASPAGIVSGLRQAGPIAIAGLVANGANVIVTVVVARLLTSRGYGELAQLNGVFLVMSMPGSALLVGVVRRVTALSEGGFASSIGRFARRLHRFAIAGVAALAICAWLVQDVVAHALSLENPGAVVPIVTAGGFWLALSIDRGLIQARRAYPALAANLLVEGAVRMAAVLVLTGAGFGVTGACVGVLVGEACAAGHARWEAGRKWAHVATLEVGSEEHDLAAGARPKKRLAVDVTIAFVCLAFLALLQNIDVILLGREAPKQSGEYAAISVAAKSLIFAAIALGGYLLPEATIRWHRGQHALKPLVTTALIVAVPGVVLLAAAIGAPRLLIRLAFGARLVGASGSLKTLVLAMVFLCITVLLTNYLLGAGKRWIAAVLVAGTAAAGAAVWAAHGVPSKTAHADLLVQAALAVVVGVGFAGSHRAFRRRPGLESVGSVPAAALTVGTQGPEGRP
jgi:O-antigen/teichoic acid export membrane protein